MDQKERDEMSARRSSKMLVLSRKKDEAIVIDGQKIRIRVIAIKGNSVRLGIEASKEVKVLREELIPDDGHPGVQPQG